MQKNIETQVIKRVKKEKEYAQISNTLINNRELSYKALGILTYILSKPDDWQVYNSDLEREGVEGEKSVRSGFNELIEKKYIQRYRVFNKDTGKVHHWETLVSEVPFTDEELISSIKESYAYDKEGEIVYQKVVFGSFTRYAPVVVNREVALLCQNGKVEKNNSKKVSTFPKPTSRKPTSRKRSTTNTNNTNTNKTNTKTSSSSKGKTTDSIHSLVELFNGSICTLKKTTTVKFMKYVEKYDKEFIEAIIVYCEERNAKSYSYFAKTIEKYIEEGITTVEAMNKSIDSFSNKNKTKKNNAIRAKEEIKAEVAFDSAIEDRMMDELAGGEVIEEKIKVSTDEVGFDIKALIEPTISETSYKTWIAGLEIEKDNETIVIGCPNAFTKDIIDNKFMHLFIDAITNKNLGKEVKLVVAK